MTRLVDDRERALHDSERQAACILQLEDVEACLGPIGMSCFSCGRRGHVKVPRSAEGSCRGEHPDRRRAAHFKKCSGCRFAHYCSSSCQNRHWTMGHKHVCQCVRIAYGHDRRRQFEQREDVRTSYGFGSVYDYALWTYLLDPENCLRDEVGSTDFTPAARRANAGSSPPFDCYLAY